MTATFAKLKTLLYLTVGFFAALGVLSVTQGRSAQAAPGPGVNLAALLAKVNAQATQIAALQAKTAALTQSGTPGTAGATLQITGDNVQIVDGTGNTSSTSGLGNLTIGYNTLRGGGDVRTGSHNLILGDLNNYSSYGGIVAGYDNTISNLYATVTGGEFNSASGYFTSVSGGYGNKASGELASVSGGQSNSASGNYASVSGGNGNSASGNYASVSGGNGNSASGNYASVSGGGSNTASDLLASVSGGYANIANNIGASVSGGSGIAQNIQYGWAAGSVGNTAYSGRFTSP